MTDNVLDLSENEHVTVSLLANPLDWRVRVVEEITVDDATTCLRRRSLQVAPIRDHLGVDVSAEHSHALLAMYVAPIPRGPLLDFDVSGPEGPGWLLPRVEIAEREALFLESLATSCGSSVSESLRTLLAAVCGFTGELLTDVNAVTLEQYLQAGLGRAVPSWALQHWQAAGEICREVLRPRLDSFRGYSAPENPALVLPELFADGTLGSDDEATTLLTEYVELITALHKMAERSQLSAAAEFLDVLADYGNYYDLMVAMKVPLDEPFLVKFSERRGLPLTFRNTATQELVIADARTNHVTLKVSDPNVRISSFSARKPARDEFAYGAFQTRKDPQSRALYAHDPDRDYRVRLSFRLAPLRRLQVVPYAVAALLGLLCAALIVEQPQDLRTLAVVAGPAALAASVLLAREPSTLGSRLRLVSSICLVAALIVLIAVSTVLFASGAREAPDRPERQHPNVPATG